MRLLGVGESSWSRAFRFGSKSRSAPCKMFCDHSLTFKNHRCHVVAELPSRRSTLAARSTLVARSTLAGSSFKRGAAIGSWNGLPCMTAGADLPGGPRQFSSANIKCLYSQINTYDRILLSVLLSIIC